MAATRHWQQRSHFALAFVLVLLLSASIGTAVGRGSTRVRASAALDETAGQTAPASDSERPVAADAVSSRGDVLAEAPVQLYRWSVPELAHDDRPPPPPAPPRSARPSSPVGLRLWSDGDSVSYFMTTNLFARLSDQGAIPVRAPDYKISSRLTRPSGYSAVLGVGFSDWFSYMSAELATFNPDIVVLLVGANDAGFVSPEAFGQDAARMMDLLRRDGRIVAWVGLPAFGREDLARNSPPLNAAAQAAAASRNWVVFVPTSSIAPDGADGVHFSSGQARLLAEAVVHVLFPGLE